MSGVFDFIQKLSGETLQNSGQQIIVMGDFNSEYADLEEWMLDLGLVNLLKERYGSEGPCTCSKSNDSPIDCISCANVVGFYLSDALIVTIEVYT